MIQKTRVQGDRNVRLREIRKKRRKIILVGATALALVCLALFAWHTHTAQRRVDGVVVTGNVLLDEEVVRTKALEVLDGTTLLVFSNRYPWLTPLARIARAVESLPAVADVSVRIGDGDGIEIFVTERIPVAIVCTPVCVLVDERGIAIGDPARATTPLPRIDIAQGIVADDSRVVPEYMLAPIREVILQLEAQSFSYSVVKVIDTQQIELFGFDVPMMKLAFVTIEGAPSRIYSAIASGELKGDLSAIAYIDARFERSIAYLPLSEVSATASTSPQQY